MEQQIPHINTNNSLQAVELIDQKKIEGTEKTIFIGIMTFILLAFTMVFLLKKNTPNQNLFEMKQNFSESATTQVLNEEQFNDIFVFKDSHEILKGIIPWPEEDKISMKDLYTRAYPVIREIYGERFDENQKIELYRLDHSSGENELNYAQPPNQLFIVDLFSKNVLVHELVHVFHYPGGRLPSTYEEGFARAVEILVTQKILGSSERSFSDAQLYDLYKSQALANGMGSIHSSFADIIIDRYILAAFAFSKAYYEDPEFFKKFNAAAYKWVKEHPEPESPPLIFSQDLGEIFAGTKPFVENTPTREWILQQGVIDYTHLKTGNHILIAGIGANRFQLIQRYEGGGEIDRGREPGDPASVTPLKLVYYDFNGNVMDSTSIFLGYNSENTQSKKSNLPPVNPGYYEAKIPSDYSGYYTLKAQMNLEGSIIETVMYGLSPYVWENKGIYGIVPDTTSGLASVFDALDKKILDVEIVGGMFYADVPMRGIYKIIIDTNGKTRYISKDNHQVVIVIE